MLEKKLIAIIRHVEKQAKQTLPIIDLQIENIIKNKIQNSPQIEKILDTLLDYGYLGVGKKEFDKLNSYYSSFNPDDAKAYERFYKEIGE